MVKKELVIKELKKIEEQHKGILNPEDVLQVAESKTNVLHSLFDWNDKTAGHQWRLQQARNLIRVCVQFIETGDYEPLKIWVQLSSDPKGYRALTNVLANEDLKNILLVDAFNEMKLFRDKYYKLKELSEVFKAMNKVIIRFSPKQKEQIKVTAKV